MTNASISIIVAFCVTGALFASPTHFSLYSDKKAKRVEDVVTVIVVESARASNDTKTQTDEKQNTAVQVSAGTGPLNFIPGMGAGMGTDNAYDGRGKTSRVGEVKATVSARVVKVYDNGNLLIEGNKEVEVNNETEILKVSGIVRSEDISSDNTIFSYKIADARIQYSGDGTNSSASKPGWLSRFFHWIF